MNTDDEIERELWYVTGALRRTKHLLTEKYGPEGLPADIALNLSKAFLSVALLERKAPEPTEHPYIVGAGTIPVYIYVDRATGEVERVVADDEALTPTDQLRLHPGTENYEVLADRQMLDAEAYSAFAKACETSVWPSWEWGW